MRSCWRTDSFGALLGRASRLALLVALCALGLAATAQARSDEAGGDWQPSTRIREFSRTELIDLLLAADGPLLVDARGDKEFARGHIPGAVNVPHKETWGRIDFYRQYEDRGIIFYCTRGGRSEIAGEGLITEGFRKIGILQGHFPGWKRSGFPVAQ